MESSNLFGRYRTLLPYEVELCNALGITDKEYLEFVDLTFQYHQDSRKGYELIPDVRCDPVSLFLMAVNAGFWTKVAITVAIAAVTYLLSDKDRGKEAPNLSVGGVQGRSRFNPVSGFEAQQDLAVLGSFIPLVYARLGVRVSSQLIWSQIRSTQYGQEINAICLFSQGELGSKPAFNTFAVGEAFLDNFPPSKLRLYFTKGGRANTKTSTTTQQEFLNESNRLNNSDWYEEYTKAANTNNYAARGLREYDDNDPFMVKLLKDYPTVDSKFEWKPSFSSVKTPFSNSTFGLYAPVSNGNAYKIPWELLLFQKDMESTPRRDQREKRKKMIHFFPRYVALQDIAYHSESDPEIRLAHREVLPGHDFDVIIEKQENEEAWIKDTEDIDPDRTKRWDKFSPWGSGDAKAVADTTRENSDRTMALGEQYMVGSALATVYLETDGNVWSPYPWFDENGNPQYTGKAYKMKVDEGGWMSFAGITDAQMPYESLVLQKCAIGSFSNTRECDVTEIGIKSTVWRKINGIQNLNECPSRQRIVSYEGDNGNIQLGSVNKFVNRLSFFKLQAKILDTDTPWKDLCNKVFCVKGSTNQPQYNSLNVKHKNRKTLEYRFLPVAGNVVLNDLADRQVYLLNYASALHTQPFELSDGIRDNAATGVLYFHGYLENLPTSIAVGNGFTNNIEWVRGGLGAGYDSEGNPTNPGEGVSSFGPLEQGEDNWQALDFSYLDRDFEPEIITTALNRARNNGNGVPWNKGGSNSEVNDYVYWGTGPGTDPDGANYGNWGRSGFASPSIRNFKGTPSTGGNSYFSRYHGVELVATWTGGGIWGINFWRWDYYFGDTIIPHASLASIDALGTENSANTENVEKWTQAIEEQDGRGNRTGRFHRFRVARNPEANNGGLDWRFSNVTDGIKTQHYGIEVQVQDSNAPVPVVTNHATVPYGTNTETNRAVTGTGFRIEMSTKSWVDANGNTQAYRTFATQPGHAGVGYYTGDQVQMVAPSLEGTYVFTVIAGTPRVDPDQEYDEGKFDSISDEHNTYFYDQRDINPNNAIADYFMFDAEDSSHSNNPEHEIVHINEIIHEGDTSAEARINYEKLAMAGLRIGASQNLKQLASLSCFIQEGIKVQRLIDDNGNYRTINVDTGKSNLFASTDNIVEIVYDLLTNTDYGAGDIAGIKAVNTTHMQSGAKYCLKNQFKWNGIIDKEINLREFIFENAGYCFLDFCIVGGQFSLRPGVPTDGNGRIRYNITRTEMESEVKALFTDGNMKDIQVTFLTPEERKMFKATVIYRQDRKDGFPETKAKTFAYRKPEEYAEPNDPRTAQFINDVEKLPEEVFDMSGWCTHESHAKKFAAHVLVTRKEVDHGLSFETTPESVLGLVAGDYIRIMTETTHTTRFNNGSVDGEGNIVSRDPNGISGNKTVYYWTPGKEGGVHKESFVFAGDGKAPDILRGTLFTVLDDTLDDRLYKIESITHGEEGFIKIGASHVPFDDDGYMSVLRYTNPDAAIGSDDYNEYKIRFPDVNQL